MDDLAAYGAAQITIGEPSSLERASPRRMGKVLLYIAVVAVAILLWQLVSLFSIPLFIPSPFLVAQSFGELLGNGTLPADVGISYVRILSGWAIGCVIAAPLGLLAGRSPIVRVITEPFLNFFRFIPAIAFLTLALIWFGLGEESKIVIVTYTTVFIIFLETMAGAQSVETDKLRAAESLGASNFQIFRTVVIPATIPRVITGMRLAMGGSFMTVVAAEQISASSGVGFLINNSGLFNLTSYAFVGIISLGLMGLFADLVLRAVLGRIAHRYSVHF